jgi:hypothetical protein
MVSVFFSAVDYQDDRMSAVNKEKSNMLSSRQDVVAALNDMLGALDKQFPAGDSRFSLGDTCADYDTDVAQMEGLSRVLWGLFPLMASGDTTPFSDKYITAIKLGTNPQSTGYWGETAPYDQRLVEMAAYGLGLALLQDKLTAVFSEGELTHLHAWLSQIIDVQMPGSNWNYFAIMVLLGFKRAAFDSMLLLADGDDYFHGRRHCDEGVWMKTLFSLAGHLGMTCRSTVGRWHLANGIFVCIVLTARAPYRQ